MSDLLSTQLSNTEVVTIGIRITESIKVPHIRPHLLLRGNVVDGSVFLRIKQGSLVLDTIEIPCTEIFAVKDPLFFARGYFRFDTNIALNHLTENEFTEYTLEIGTIGASQDAGNNVSILSDLRQAIDIYDEVSKAAYNIELYTI